MKKEVQKFLKENGYCIGYALALFVFGVMLSLFFVSADGGASDAQTPRKKNRWMMPAFMRRFGQKQSKQVANKLRCRQECKKVCD